MSAHRHQLLVWSPQLKGTTGGVQSHSRDLIDRLKSDHLAAQVHVLTYPSPINTLHKIWNQISFFTQALFSFLQKPDLIFVTHLDLAPVAAILTRFRKVPYVVSCHGIEVWDQLPQSKLEALQKAKLLLCVSRFTQDLMLENFHIHPDQTFIFPNTTYFPQALTDQSTCRSKLAQKHQIPTEHHIIFTLGRMRPTDREKGYGKLVEALALLNKGGVPTTLIAGGEGPDRNWIQNIAKAADISDFLICPGRIASDEVDMYYRGCDLFALPSKKEGFGIVFLEAMAQGTPVLAGNEDGSREPLLDGKLGLLCNPENPENIADTISSFFHNADHPLKDEAFIRNTARENFGQAAYDSRLIKLFEHFDLNI